MFVFKWLVVRISNLDKVEAVIIALAAIVAAESELVTLIASGSLLSWRLAASW